MVEIFSGRISRTGQVGRAGAVRVDATGSFRCDDLVPGAYLAYLRIDGAIFDCRSFEVAAGEVASMDLAAHDGTPVDIVARPPGLWPAASRVSIEVFDLAGERRVRRELEADDASEPIEFRWVAPAGAYRARVTTDVGLLGQSEFVVGAEELRVLVELAAESR